MELHLTNWNYLETVMFIDTTLVAKIILDLHQLNGTRVNKEPVIMPLKTGPQKLEHVHSNTGC